MLLFQFGAGTCGNNCPEKSQPRREPPSSGSFPMGSSSGILRAPTRRRSAPWLPDAPARGRGWGLTHNGWRKPEGVPGRPAPLLTPLHR